MIKPFRYGILSVQLDCEAAAHADARKDDVVYELQALFGNLMLSDQRCYNPLPWTQAYKDESGKATNVLVQQDAQVGMK